ncbi:SagB family peptide dehydrogenase [Streptomyces chartreusis]|uniref:SagB family peptide dehydrogenase n=1 Tax=Streptomyces chartreusis TaxID=1969 RepID=UPI00369F687C
MVWDDYLEHRQFALSEGTEKILRWFTVFRPLESVSNLDAAATDAVEWREMAYALTRHNILIEQGSSRHQMEQKVVQAWSKWGPLTRAYHFSARLHANARFTTIADDQDRLEDKAHTDPPPPAFLTYPSARQIQLPEVSGTAWQHQELGDVLHQRRSRRHFGSRAVDLPELADILRSVFGALPQKSISVDGCVTGAAGHLTDHWQRVLKTSPSGGARCPTEPYVYAKGVDGLEPGMYHYSSGEHALEKIGPKVKDEKLVAACGDQEWISNAAVILFYTSIIERSQWKYDSARAYRTLLLDVGHLSQNIYLVAAASKVHVTFTAALRDELVEQLIGCDPARQIIVGASVIGPCGGPYPDDPEHSCEQHQIGG